MPLDVTLGDFTWRWQLKDDRPVEDWLGRRPWLGEGGVIVVQAPDDEHVTLDALEREVLAEDRRASDVRVIRLDAEDGQLSDLVGRWLNTSRRRPRDLALALAADLEARPAILLVDGRNAPGPAPWADDAFALWDLASKLEDIERRPAFVVIHRRGEAPLRGRYVLDRGWPVGLARALLEATEDHLWEKYVHLRFAWESGGVIDDAVDCAAIAGDGPSDDDDLERVLNSFAVAKFNLMTDEEREGWARYVENPSGEPVPTVLGYAEEPDGRLTPLPWIARALLLRGDAHPSTARALRAEITCRPIAEQVLNRCFAAEASLRRRLPAALPPAPDDLVKQYDRFVANVRLGRAVVPMLVAELYPSAHPWPPADPWDFASVGLIVNEVATSPSHRVELNRVTLLRNAVAHCHYMGWRGVVEARALRAILA